MAERRTVVVTGASAGIAIVWASRHQRREVWVGRPAVQAITSNRFIAPLLDRLLAKKAYDGQHKDEAIDPDRQDNLYTPVAGNAGGHGRFDQRSKSRSFQLWADTHRGTVAGACLAFIAGAALAQRWK